MYIAGVMKLTVIHTTNLPKMLNLPSDEYKLMAFSMCLSWVRKWVQVQTSHNPLRIASYIVLLIFSFLLLYRISS